MEPKGGRFTYRFRGSMESRTAWIRPGSGAVPIRLLPLCTPPPLALLRKFIRGRGGVGVSSLKRCRYVGQPSGKGARCIGCSRNARKGFQPCYTLRAVRRCSYRLTLLRNIIPRKGDEKFTSKVLNGLDVIFLWQYWLLEKEVFDLSFLKRCSNLSKVIRR